MKRLIAVSCLGLFFFFSKAQSEQAEQLVLDWEKLTQFKKILQNMRDGYDILYKGYTTVKNISQGNFSLHKNYLDALLEVSPFVQKYRRIAAIVECQQKIVREYKAALRSFRDSKSFSSGEMDYISGVYSNLLDRSLKSLDELIMVITSGTLRMSDDERLQAIDRIYASVSDQLSFLRDFNNNTAFLSLQRKSEQADLDISRDMNK